MSNQALKMKKLLLLLMVAAIFAACSAPKYTYYFDRYSLKKNTARVTDLDVKSDDVPFEKSSLTPAIIASGGLSPAQDPQLFASASKSFSLQPDSENSIISNDSKTTLKKVTRADRRELLKAVREFKEKSPDAIKEGSKSKNGFAIAGFVSSIVGMLVLWPLCIVGLILSAIGLKSEKRGLAIAGLVIGIVGVVLVLAIGGAALAGA